MLVRVSDPMRRLVGAAVGGGLGYALFWWQQQTGIWIVAATGIGLGLGAGLGARSRSTKWGLLMGLVALAYTLIVAWQHYPFRADKSLFEFVGTIPQRSANEMWTYLAVLLAGFWFGMGRNRRKPA
jgi:hypothetical protein